LLASATRACQLAADRSISGADEAFVRRDSVLSSSVLKSIIAASRNF